MTYVSKKIQYRKYRKSIRKTILKNINFLDNHEKALLREFYINGKHTLQLPLDNETVVGLLNKHIIFQASSTGFSNIYGICFPYSITDIAKENLTNSIIDLPSNPTEQDRIRIINERPYWAKEKDRLESIFKTNW